MLLNRKILALTVIQFPTLPTTEDNLLVWVLLIIIFKLQDDDDHIKVSETVENDIVAQLLLHFDEDPKLGNQHLQQVSSTELALH